MVTFTSLMVIAISEEVFFKLYNDEVLVSQKSGDFCLW